MKDLKKYAQEIAKLVVEADDWHIVYNFARTIQKEVLDRAKQRIELGFERNDIVQDILDDLEAMKSTPTVALAAANPGKDLK